MICLRGPSGSEDADRLVVFGWRPFASSYGPGTLSDTAAGRDKELKRI